MENVELIKITIETLGGALIGLMVIGLATIGYGKEKLKISDKSAEVFSLIVGFILSGLIAWVFVESFDYVLELGQWVGVALFVLLGTIGPSGGYKVIGSFAGSR